MKRSDYEAQFLDAWALDDGPARLAQLAANLAEKAGVSWSPEEERSAQPRAGERCKLDTASGTGVAFGREPPQHLVPPRSRDGPAARQPPSGEHAVHWRKLFGGG